MYKVSEEQMVAEPQATQVAEQEKVESVSQEDKVKRSTFTY